MYLWLIHTYVSVTYTHMYLWLIHTYVSVAYTHICICGLYTHMYLWLIHTHILTHWRLQWSMTSLNYNKNVDNQVSVHNAILE